MDMDFAPRHQITRVRRETRRRTLNVTAVERLTQGMQRIRFTSPDLHDFTSGAADDHIKLFLPSASEPGGLAGGTYMRDYTPRAFDAAAGSLTIDFALHESGPATAWAMSAKVGDTLEIGGPRGSNIVADDFDWYLLIGDETALPAIGRRVEELRPAVPVTTIVVIESEEDRQTFETAAEWTGLWTARQGRSGDDAALLRQAMAGLELASGDGYVWIAAEARVARALRTHVIETLGHPSAWVKASGYWSRGEEAAHETIQD